MVDLLLIILILAGIWYWWDTQQSNEIALFVCKKKCEAASLQLLDASVSRQRVWLRRGSGGYVQICRLYGFEYSENQATDFGQRQHGYIVLIGRQVVETSMPHGESESRQIH